MISSSKNKHKTSWMNKRDEIGKSGRNNTTPNSFKKYNLTIYMLTWRIW